MDSPETADEFVQTRLRMVEHDLKGRDIADAAVLQVMADTPREEFVPPEYRSQAYHDGPLPIGLGQTISQPYIVALMTQRLRINRDCDVLEIGTGSGYQTAVLARLAGKVYTMEKLAALADAARVILTRMGMTNIEYCVGDGSCGWPEWRTFDRIIITAAVPTMPQPLVNQLAEGGLMVGPVGYEAVQDLRVCEKRAGKIIETVVCGCRFVRLFGKHGFDEK